MKFITAFAALALMASPSFAQTVLTTYYVIPPTNGCNGLGAFGPASSMWTAPCTAPYLYVVEPNACAQGSAPGQPFWISGDTVYTNLCSTPCNITVWDASGGECVILCQLPGIMGMVTDVSESLFRVDPNPLSAGSAFKISTHLKGPFELTIADAQGRVVERRLITSNATVINTAHLDAGLHLLSARWSDGRSITQRLLVQ